MAHISAMGTADRSVSQPTFATQVELLSQRHSGHGGRSASNPHVTKVAATASIMKSRRDPLECFSETSSGCEFRSYKEGKRRGRSFTIGILQFEHIGCGRQL